MPLYEYLCGSCGHRFERIQKFSDAPIRECPTCGGPVEKQISSPAIQFKGAGWYVTDYANKSGSGEKKGSSRSGDSSSDSAKGETKADTKSGGESTAAADKPSAPAASAPAATSTDKKA